MGGLQRKCCGVRGPWDAVQVRLAAGLVPRFGVCGCLGVPGGRGSLYLSAYSYFGPAVRTLSGFSVLVPQFPAMSSSSSLLLMVHSEPSAGLGQSPAPHKGLARVSPGLDLHSPVRSLWRLRTVWVTGMHGPQLWCPAGPGPDLSLFRGDERLSHLPMLPHLTCSPPQLPAPWSKSAL